MPCNLLGHNHPDLIAVAWGKMEDRAPVFAQASIRDGAARLAKALCQRLGDFVVTCTNSGTEAIEASIKHAYLPVRDGTVPESRRLDRGAGTQLTVWKASASHGTLTNLLIVAGIGMPFVIAYTACAYWVFWSKRSQPVGE